MFGAGGPRDVLLYSGAICFDDMTPRTVREKFPDCKVFVDANDSRTVEETCEHVRSVADADLCWIQEPFDENADEFQRRSWDGGI
jgi:L-alanine-DL-glutamate epimerase-like enolase superfamily enzyme